MYLENIVFDAPDPRALGLFWEAALGTARLTDDEGGYETRLAVPGGPVLDLCFQPVPEPPTGPPRVHLDLWGGLAQHTIVARLLDAGAEYADIGQGEVPWVVLADPAGNPFCVSHETAREPDDGPVSAISLAAAEPEQDREFWRWLTGWVTVEESTMLRHPSGRGPVLALRPEARPKGTGKNPIHLDVRLEPGEAADAVAAEITARGGREGHHPDWGDLPWRTYLDPSGNEFCVLPASE